MIPLTIEQADQICKRMNARAGRGPNSGQITIQKILDAMEGRLLAHHPVTGEILGEVTRLERELAEKRARKSQPKKPKTKHKS